MKNNDDLFDKDIRNRLKMENMKVPEKINKKIDGILGKWFKDGIKTLDDVAKKDIKKTSSIKKPFNKNNSAPIQKKPAREANFTQRDYDYDSLEKQLLGWDIE